MKTLIWDFKIDGDDATIIVDFSDDIEQPIAAIRLSYKTFVSVGVDNVKDCLGSSYDKLITRVLAIKNGDLTA